MSNNIFNPKGRVDRSTFIINYVVLIVLYILLGIGLFTIVKYDYKLILLPIIVLFFMKILFTFNYKKRIFDCIKNLQASIILAIILGFDAEIISPLLPKIGNSVWLFFLTVVLLFVVPPAILVCMPSRED